MFSAKTPVAAAFPVLLAAFLAAAAASAAGFDLTGRWEAEVLGANVAAEFEQTGKLLKGVLYVPDINGKTNVYHLAGTVVDDQFAALHGSGHLLRGSMPDNNTAQGVFTLKTGEKIPLRFHRCGPPPSP